MSGLVISSGYKLKNADKKYNDHFKGEEKIYINVNLTPYFSALAWKCRKLKKKKLISNLKVYGGNIKFTCGDSDEYSYVRSEDDLKAIFSEEELVFSD